jgi:ribosome biogenesis GTPase A
VALKIVLHVIDARFPEDSRNREIEDRVKDAGKRILYVINKTDLVGIELAKEIARGIQPSVFVSSKEKLGGTILLKSILKMSEGKSVTVGVVGYPNVGKSSVINLLKGKKSSSVSPQQAIQEASRR